MTILLTVFFILGALSAHFRIKDAADYEEKMTMHKHQLHEIKLAKERAKIAKYYGGGDQ